MTEEVVLKGEVVKKTNGNQLLLVGLHYQLMWLYSKILELVVWLGEILVANLWGQWSTINQV